MNQSKAGQSDLKCILLFCICAVFSFETESRESGYESGILVSKAVDLDINGAKLKPAGELLKSSATLLFKSFIFLIFFVNTFIHQG